MDSCWLGSSSSASRPSGSPWEAVLADRCESALRPDSVLSLFSCGGVRWWVRPPIGGPHIAGHPTWGSLLPDHSTSWAPLSQLPLPCREWNLCSALWGAPCPTPREATLHQTATGTQSHCSVLQTLKGLLSTQDDASTVKDRHPRASTSLQTSCGSFPSQGGRLCVTGTCPATCPPGIRCPAVPQGP